ncbi:hypothetical protein PV326_007443, partial [Microctonus aethiopoides]
MNHVNKRYNRGLLDVSADKVTKLLRNGNAEFNIPVFDPHHIEKFEMNVNEDGLKIDGELRNINLQGLSNIENIITDISFWRRKITLTLTFPEIISTGEYDFKMIQTGDITHSSSGNYEAIVRNIAATAIVEYSFFLTSANLKDVEVNDIKLIKISTNEIENNLEINIFRSQTTSETALKFCSRSHIKNFLEMTLSEILNTIIDGKSVSKIKS